MIFPAKSLVSFLVATATAVRAADHNPTILEIVVASEAHNTLEAAVLAAPPSISELLSSTATQEGLTLFAPDDNAFGAVNGDFLQLLLTEKWSDHLTCLLSSHVLASTVLSTDILGQSMVESLSGFDLDVLGNTNGVFINEIPVTGADIVASNGVVHVISAQPILPDCVTSDIHAVLANESPLFSTLEGLLEAAELVEIINLVSPATLLAPTNQAFEDVPQEVLDYLGRNSTALFEVLGYHVILSLEKLERGDVYETIEGSSLFVTANGNGELRINGNSNVVGDRLLAYTGAIYPLDTVLLPPGFTITDPMPTPASSSILDIVVASEVHNTLEAAVLAAPSAIAELLASPSEGGLTLFAPDDMAFGAVDPDFLQLLLTEEWSDHLVCVLASHVIASTVLSTDIQGRSTVESASGFNLAVASNEAGVFVDNVQVTGADIEASNGIVHVISARPILPDCITAGIFDVVADTNTFSTLERLLVVAGLDTTVNEVAPLTLLAPTDAAFAAVPQEVLDYLGSNADALAQVLTYHVIPSLEKLSDGTAFTTLEGSDVQVTINESGDFVINGDTGVGHSSRTLTSNGAIYTIDAVLLPPGFTITDPMPTPASSSILDIVVASEVHNTLEAAVLAAPSAIAELLASPSEGGLTLFAPDDMAFGAVDPDFLQLLLTEEWSDHLVCVLASHVITSTVLSTDIQGRSTVESASGFNLAVASNEAGVFVDNVQVTGADIEASNGIVHVISARPILPDCITAGIFDVVADTNTFSTLERLLVVAGLDTTVNEVAPLTLLAPTDAAFAAVPQEVLDYLGSNADALAQVLTYHVIPSLEKLSDDTAFTTLEGSDVQVTINESGNFVINGNTGVGHSSRTLTSNGAIYTIDTVLLPPGFTIPPPDDETTDDETTDDETIVVGSTIVDIVVASEDHNTLEAAVLAAPDQIAELLSSPSEDGLTLFAPDDEAFGAVDDEYLGLLLTDPWTDHLVCFLTSHVIESRVLSTEISGESFVGSLSRYELDVVGNSDGVFVDTIKVTGPDILASNGVLHVLSDQPILPDCITQGIFTVVESDPSLSTLKSLLVAAGLDATVNSVTPLTLLAPTDEAFESVPANVLDYLSENATALSQVLTYHVVPSLEKLTGEASVATLEGSNIEVSIDGGGNLKINDATMVLSERSLAANGAIYTIDSVLIPPSFTSTVASLDTSASSMKHVPFLLTSAIGTFLWMMSS